MTIYLDLDGPLLDVWRRYHEVYRSIITFLGSVPADRQTYWRLKRCGRRETEICAAIHPDVEPARYTDLFLARIESPLFLAADRPVPGALGTLAALRGRHRLVLATLRRRGGPMRGQLSALGLLDLLDGILQTESNDGTWKTKAGMVAGDPGFDRGCSLLVGDTEGDVRAARQIGIPAVGVCDGLRDAGVLTAAGPCSLIESIAGLVEHVEGRPAIGGTMKTENRSCARW